MLVIAQSLQSGKEKAKGRREKGRKVIKVQAKVAEEQGKVKAQHSHHL